LKEFGDKIPSDKKSAIEAALTELKAAHQSRDLNQIEAALTSINAAWSVASEDMYKASQEAGPQGASGTEGASAGGPEVTDVDFEEVKDEK
jgi:molecular chaperone DnaK